MSIPGLFLRSRFLLSVRFCNNVNQMIMTLFLISCISWKDSSLMCLLEAKITKLFSLSVCNVSRIMNGTVTEGKNGMSTKTGAHVSLSNTRYPDTGAIETTQNGRKIKNYINCPYSYDLIIIFRHRRQVTFCCKRRFCFMNCTKSVILQMGIKRVGNV